MKKILSVLLTAALLCSVSAGAFSFETESDETVPSTKDTSASMDAQEVADAIGKPDEESLSEVMEAIDDESSEQSAQTPVGRNVEEFDEATDQQEVAAEFVQEQNAGMESVEESDDSSDGDMVLPVTLDVTVPDSSHIIINPYCIPIDLNGVRYREQIVCQENLITSGTNIPLRVRGRIHSGGDRCRDKWYTKDKTNERWVGQWMERRNGKHIPQI